MKKFKGIPGAPGLAYGRVFYYEKSIALSAKISIDEAVKKALEEVSTLEEKAKKDIGEEQAKIFSAYKMFLEDPMFISPMKEAEAEGVDSIKAVRDVSDKMSKVMASKGSEYMRQRADDIKYVAELIISAMAGEDTQVSNIEKNEKIIVAAYELTPVDTMKFNPSQLVGLICEKGGATSHTVILAKSLGIPAIVGAKGIKECRNEKYGYIDGYTGELITNPDEAAEREYSSKLDDEVRLNNQMKSLSSSDTYTKDKKRISLCINIGNPTDIKSIDNVKFDGVGLYRSEFLYSSMSEKPSKNEQIESYKKVIEKIHPNTVIIRTIDVGGDKQISYLNMKEEENPFLGNRGIRLCLKNTEIFSEQLEAILIAGTDKSVKIMLPMVTSVKEITETKAIIEKVKEKLDNEGIDYCKNVLVGIMIETPASAVTADILAEYCDFFSIGTNDLIQYVMSADRGNSDVGELYTPYHPSVLRMINRVIKTANEKNIEVSVCGDLAANTDFTELLIGMGLRKFSVPFPMVNRIKYKISLIDSTKAEKLSEEVLNASDEEKTKEIIKRG